MKKLLAIVLALACCLSCFAFVASAAAAEAPAGLVSIVDWSKVDAESESIKLRDLGVIENGMLTLTIPNATYADPVIDIMARDDETGEVVEGSTLAGFTSTIETLNNAGLNMSGAGKVVMYLEIEGDLAVDRIGDFILVLGNQAVDADGNLCEGKTMDFLSIPLVDVVDWAAVATDGFAGYVEIPLSACNNKFWGVADENNAFDTQYITYMQFFLSTYTNDEAPLTIKVGDIGFVAPEIGLLDAPVGYTQWIDFTDWTDEELAPFAKNEELWTVVPSVDENGLMTLTSSNTSYTQYYAPGTNVAYKDDETGEITGPYPGTTLSFNDGYAFTGINDKENGVAFWVDLSNWAGGRTDDNGNELVALYFNDLDFTAEGSVTKVAGAVKSTTYVAEAAVAPGYVGWVTVPFAECRVGEWDSPENNNMVDMNTVDWFMIYPNVPNGGGVYKIGKIGFYGEAFEGNTFNYTAEKPEGAMTLVDFTKATEDWAEWGWTYDNAYYSGAVDAEAGQFVFTHKQTEIKGQMWWGWGGFAPQITGVEENEDGDIVGFKHMDGLNADFSAYQLPEDLSKAGVYFYVDLSDLAENAYMLESDGGNFPFQFILIEQDCNAEGELKPATSNPSKQKSAWGQAAGTGDKQGYAARLSLPLGYKGYVYLPFSDFVYREDWEKDGSSTNTDGKLNMQLIRGIHFDFNDTVINEAGDTATWAIGEIGFYGLEEVQEEESSTPTTPDDDNKNENPDTGVTGVAGVASVAAIIALAAVVCFRKKD